MKKIRILFRNTTFRLSLLSVVICFIAFYFISPPLEKLIYMQSTPSIQNVFDVDASIIDSSNGNIIEHVQGPQELLHPFSKAISILLTTILVSLVEFSYVRCKIKSGTRYPDIEKLLTIIKIVLVFCALVTAVFSLYDLGTSTEFLQQANEPLFKGILYSLVKNGRKINEVLSIVTVSVSALIFPYDYCSKKETQKKLEEKINEITSLNVKDVKIKAENAYKNGKHCLEIAKQEAKKVAIQEAEKAVAAALDSYTKKSKKKEKYSKKTSRA